LHEQWIRGEAKIGKKAEGKRERDEKN